MDYLNFHCINVDISFFQVCFAHGGGAFPFTIGRIEHGFNVRPDLCAVNCQVNPREYLGRVYTDSLVHDADALDLLLKVIGEVRIRYVSYQQLLQGVMFLYATTPC